MSCFELFDAVYIAVWTVVGLVRTDLSASKKYRYIDIYVLLGQMMEVIIVSAYGRSVSDVVCQSRPSSLIPEQLIVGYDSEMEECLRHFSSPQQCTGYIAVNIMNLQTFSLFLERSS